MVLPFSFAVFVAAGVAPLPTGNPMNLVLSQRAGIGFNDYALTIIPVYFAQRLSRESGILRRE